MYSVFYMMWSLEVNHWSTIINIILQKYFSELTTTCILWHKDFNIDLASLNNTNVVLIINSLTLEESFKKDVYNFSQQDEHFNERGVYYNDMIKKYIAAIEKTNCEGFLAFQDDIPLFAETFRKASVYSIWRTTYTKFLFVYAKEKQKEDYIQDILFQNQANILIIQADFMNSSIFSLKTNKFVGSIFENPQQLILLTTFNALNNSFSFDIDVYSKEKLQDLQGREIIVAAFDYRPIVAVDYSRLPLNYDRSEDNPTHLVHIDGIETRLCHTFCEIYNCTVQFDTSEKEEWGTSYDNYSGYGLIGMIMDGKVDMANGGMFAWDSDYMAVDISTVVSRSGVTCLVPAPERLVSWNLSLKPFQFTLWLAVFACLCLESISLLIARHFELSCDESNINNSWLTSLKFGYSTALKIFISQGSDYIVNTNTVRTVLFACYMIDIIVTSIYGGGLSAILTLPTLGESADSVARLYKHNIPWAATSYEWVESIKDDNDPIFQRLLKNFKVFTFDEIREKAKSENMAFALERLTFGHFGNFEFITPESLRNLKLMVDDIYYGQSVIMVSRLWAHLPKFNDLILAWRSSGFDKFWEWKITAEYLNVKEQNQVQSSRYANFGDGPSKLGMDNFGGLVLLWLVGMGVSVLCFVGELVLFYMKKQN